MTDKLRDRDSALIFKVGFLLISVQGDNDNLLMLNNYMYHPVPSIYLLS